MDSNYTDCLKSFHSSLIYLHNGSLSLSPSSVLYWKNCYVLNSKNLLFSIVQSTNFIQCIFHLRHCIFQQRKFILDFFVIFCLFCVMWSIFKFLNIRNIVIITFLSPWILILSFLSFLLVYFSTHYGLYFPAFCMAWLAARHCEFYLVECWILLYSWALFWDAVKLLRSSFILFRLAFKFF